MPAINPPSWHNYNMSSGYIGTGYSYNTSAITVGYQPSLVPPPREKTALEWLREQVAETCAEAKVAA